MIRGNKMQSVRIYVDDRDEYVEIPISFNTTFSDIINCCNVQEGNSYFLIKNVNEICEKVLDLESNPMNQFGTDVAEYTLHSLKLPFSFTKNSNMQEIGELLRKNRSLLEYNKRRTHLMKQKMKILRLSTNRRSYQDQGTKERMERRLRMLRSGKAPPDFHSAGKHLEFLKEAFQMAQEDLYLLAEKIKLERESMNKKEIKVEADDKLDSLRRSDWLFNNQPKKEDCMVGSETPNMDEWKESLMRKGGGETRPQTMLASSAKRAFFGPQLSATERLIGSRSSQFFENQITPKPFSGNFDRFSKSSFDFSNVDKKTHIPTFPLSSASTQMLVPRPNSVFTPSHKYSTFPSPPSQTRETPKNANDDATVAYDRDSASEMKLSNLITQTSEVKKAPKNLTPKPLHKKKEKKIDFSTKPPPTKKSSTKRVSAPPTYNNSGSPIHPFNQAFLNTISKFEELSSPTDSQSESTKFPEQKNTVINNAKVLEKKEEKYKEEKEEEEEMKKKKDAENKGVATDQTSATFSISQSEEPPPTEVIPQDSIETDVVSMEDSTQQIEVTNNDIHAEVTKQDENVIRDDKKHFKDVIVENQNKDDETMGFIRTGRRDSYREGVRFDGEDDDDDECDDDVSDVNDTDEDIDDIEMNNYGMADHKIRLNCVAKKTEEKQKKEDEEYKTKKEREEININSFNLHTDTSSSNNNPNVNSNNKNRNVNNEANHKFFKRPLQDHHQHHHDVSKRLVDGLINGEGVKQEILEGDSFFSIQTSFPAHLSDEEEEKVEDEGNGDEEEKEEKGSTKERTNNDTQEFSMTELLQQMDGSLLRHPAVGVRSLRKRDSYEDHHHPHHQDKKNNNDDKTTGSGSEDDERNEKLRKKTTFKKSNEGNIEGDDGSYGTENIKEVRESSGSDEDEEEEDEDGDDDDDDDDRYSPLIDTFTAATFDGDKNENKKDEEKSETDKKTILPPPQLLRRRFLECQPPEVMGGGVIPFKSNLKKDTKLDKIMEAEKKKMHNNTLAENEDVVKTEKNPETNDEEGRKEKRGISFDAVSILLDAALQGELQVVKEIIAQHGHEGMANEEGITALHNSICACNTEISSFLINSGCDVNAPDADLWTPLHCAASCSNQSLCKLLIEGGACPFALTLTEDESCFDKCDENDSDDEDEDSCALYMKGLEEQMQTEGTKLYAAYDYQAQADNELSFKTSDVLVYLKGEENGGQNWFYCRHFGSETEGLVPRNYLGLHPRMKVS